MAILVMLCIMGYGLGVAFTILLTTSELFPGDVFAWNRWVRCLVFVCGPASFAVLAACMAIGLVVAALVGLGVVFVDAFRGNEG